MDNTHSTEPNDVFSSKESSTQSWSSTSHIHFPAHEAISTRPSRHRSEGLKLPSGLTPPIRRGSPLNPQNVNQATDSRRRPWPSDVLLVSPESLSRHRRNTSLNLSSTPRIDSIPPIDGGQEVGVFSDEYDLSHEDPRILQDVQRALKLKARREARLKKETSGNEKTDSPEQSPSSHQYKTPPRVPSSLRPSLSPSSYPSTSRKSSTNTNVTSEVDFSPSTGIPESPLRPHPVPSSIDNGRSLDWTSSNQEDGDKRRIMGIGKKKEKDKMPLFGLMMDQNEQLYEAKLLHIKNHISNQTWRKSDITSDQLSRRYNLLDESTSFREGPINLLAVVKWHQSQQEWYRKSLERSEPFTWLKHLERRNPTSLRSPWHLSALALENFAQSRGQSNNHLQTITEDSTSTEVKVPQTRKSRSPSFLSSRAHALGSSVSMTQPVDASLSFEPFAEGKRNSMDAASRLSADSGPSSLNSISSPPNVLPLSPISTRSTNDALHMTPARPRSPASSSSVASNDSYDDNDIKDLHPTAKPQIIIPEVSVLPPPSNDIPPPVISNTPLALSSSQGSSGSSQTRPVPSPPKQISSSLKIRRVPHNLYPLRVNKKTREQRENSLRVEYEAKHRLLQESIAYNNKTRHFLNKLSSVMKDFDSIQNTAMQTQGLPRIDIPRDLLEAFGHDPAAVTGATRRDRGWRAVEDINYRVERQRAVLRSFIKSYVELPPGEGCLLDEPIDNIADILESLEQYKIQIAAEEETVSTLLSYVQHIHSKVKESYHATMSLVSFVYPELSIIIALEESYKDQYQQFWELGMDALTLLLDTVTPFWRTYGKTIGEDVRDFLIVPLYRNEFTGEPKSYPILALPKRSSRHWLGLFFFFLLSIAVNILQLRAAMSSTMHFRLHLIPYDGVRWTALPFFWVGIVIQWLAVLLELAVVFFQVGVIAWWAGWYVKFVS